MVHTGSSAERASHPLSAALRPLWAARTWWATIHLATGALVGVVGFVSVSVLLVLTVALVPTLVGAAVAFALLLLVVRGLTGVQRSRFESLLGVGIPSHPAARTGTVRRLQAIAKDGATWRQLGYHLLAGLLGTVAGVVVMAFWCGGVFLTLTILWGPLWGDLAVLPAAGLSLVGLVLLLAAPWVARAAAEMDVAIGQSLLTPASTEDLSRRVTALAASREEAVNAADTERRRIERDLHDGVQQRLTSLAMNLGIARTTMTDLPQPARGVIDEAHDEVKQALVDLRLLVRGMHPAVLDDRGLDAALSGIAAASALPVRLTVSMRGRAAREVEAVAYFVVSEALTNATNHADASDVEVVIGEDSDRLRVCITDDGRGGADPEAGTGLRGLSERVRSVGGTIRVDSPVGGPTTVSVELPCRL